MVVSSDSKIIQKAYVFHRIPIIRISYEHCICLKARKQIHISLVYQFYELLLTQNSSQYRVANFFPIQYSYHCNLINPFLK